MTAARRSAGPGRSTGKRPRLGRIEHGLATDEPVARALEVRDELLIAHRPFMTRHPGTTVEVDRIVGDAASAPDRRGAADPPTGRHRHRRMEGVVESRGVPQRLDARVIRGAAALDQHHVEARVRDLERDDDPGGPAPTIARSARSSESTDSASTITMSPLVSPPRSRPDPGSARGSKPRSARSAALAAASIRPARIVLNRTGPDLSRSTLRAEAAARPPRHRRNRRRRSLQRRRVHSSARTCARILGSARPSTPNRIVAWPSHPGSSARRASRSPRRSCKTGMPGPSRAAAASAETGSPATPHARIRPADRADSRYSPRRLPVPLLPATGRERTGCPGGRCAGPAGFARDRLGLRRRRRRAGRGACRPCRRSGRRPTAGLAREGPERRRGAAGPAPGQPRAASRQVWLDPELRRDHDAVAPTVRESPQLALGEPEGVHRSDVEMARCPRPARRPTVAGGPRLLGSRKRSAHPKPSSLVWMPVPPSRSLRMGRSTTPSAAPRSWRRQLRRARHG